MIHQNNITITTQGRGTIDISRPVADFVKQSGVDCGICHIFIHHTSASLILCENADPTVRSDLERFMRRLVPDGDALFEHTMEGPDDMPAHVRNILTQSELSIPITAGRCALGTWQGIYLWEHRSMAHQRKLTITIYS